ncbi:MAG: hypothetical protein O2812_00780 [Chloroflexi bacterium]|nr:hypothetical protein [Chloroflexota bacterium]
MNKSSQQNSQNTEAALGPRSWRLSAVAAVALVTLGVSLSAIINPLLGRYVHWDWMAGLAPALFILALFALRRRWV